MATMLADGDVEIEGRVVCNQPMAILLDDGQRQVWLPRRFVSIQELQDNYVIVRMRRWVAREKGYA